MDIRLLKFNQYNRDNTVSVINGQTNTVVATIPVGNEPDAIGVLY